MKYIHNILFVGILIIGLISSCKKERSLLSELNEIPGVEITEIEPDSTFNVAYKIMFTQPLDHNNPDGKTFKQRIFLNHRGFDNQTVLVTEGYAAKKYNATKELAPILKGNELRVEHRFFGESLPDSMEWTCLNTTQATADYHRIIGAFKKIYTGNWVSTGWSKGGQTSIIYKQNYPDDVKAVVAYDAPINLELEEKRIDEFFENVGTEFCRQRLIDFQRLVLKNKKEILPLYEKYAEEKEFTFNMIEPLKSLEFSVLEYTFSFWQYEQIDCNDIPVEGASLEEILKHLTKVVYAGSYSDNAMNSASIYQFVTELGYYGYVQKNVKDLLSYDSYKNSEFAPQEADLTYSPDRAKRLHDWLMTEAENIICIYGDKDPWAAPAVEFKGATNSFTVFLKGGNHYSFINNFPTEERNKILSSLEDWLGMKIER